jgi:hypothetical protein
MGSATIALFADASVFSPRRFFCNPEDILPLIDSSRAQDLTAHVLVIGQSVGQMAA